MAIDFSRCCLPLRDKQHRSGIENASRFLMFTSLPFPSPRCPAAFSFYSARHSVCPTRTFTGKNCAASIYPRRPPAAPFGQGSCKPGKH